MAVRGLRAALAGRMRRVDVAPEHVLDAVGRIEDAYERATVEPIECRVQHRLALAVDVIRLPQERRIVGDAFVEGPGVFGQSQRREGSDAGSQVARVVRRMRDRHRRALGVEVDGRQVEREVLAALGEQQPRQAGDGNAGHSRKRQRDPRTQFALRHGYARGADRDIGRAAVIPGDDVQGEGERGLAVEQRVRGAGERAVHGSALAGHRQTDAALLEAPGGRACRGQQERALRAEQVGHAHRAELGAIELVRRKCDGHPQDGAPDAVLAEDGPERLRPSQQPEVGTAQRQPEAAELQDARHRPDHGGRQLRQVGAAVAVEEVEDVVARRVRAGAERRPGHR